MLKKVVLEQQNVRTMGESNFVPHRLLFFVNLNPSWDLLIMFVDQIKMIVILGAVSDLAQVINRVFCFFFIWIPYFVSARNLRKTYQITSTHHFSPSNFMTLNILRPTNFFFTSHPPPSGYFRLTKFPPTQYFLA